MQSYILAVISLEITFFLQGKMQITTFSLTTTEMGGPTNEKKFCSQLSRQSVTTLWIGSNSKKVSANTTAFHFGSKTRMFPDTLGKLEEGGIQGFGFMTV